MLTRNDKRPGMGPVRAAVLLGLFIGTGVGVGFLLSGIPNVELMTFIAALAGGVLGPGLGFLSGACCAVIYSLGSPYGLPVPLLLGAQALGMGGAGLLGGWFARPIVALRRGGRHWRAAQLALGCGLLATLGYDLLTNGAIALAFDTDVRIVAAAAAPFVLLHLGGNLPPFLLLFPALATRGAQLARSPLRGGTLGALAIILSCWTVGVSADGMAGSPVGDEDASAVADSLLMAVADTLLQPAMPDPAAGAPDSLQRESALPVDRPWGRRPPWRPFDANLLTALARHTFWTVDLDGGFGSRVILQHEFDTSPTPLLARDGVPLGTGHRWADDPWLVAITGLEIAQVTVGLDEWGGTAGRIDLSPVEEQPQQSVTDTRFYKGEHGSYLRSFSFRTPRAPLRLRFDFEETLDQEGYDFRPAGDYRFAGVPALGEGKFRSGRGRLERSFGPEASLTLEVETSRKHKTGIPAANLLHEELWSDHASLTWRDHNEAGRLRVSLFWTATDVQRNWQRKLETSREGMWVEIRGGPGQERLLRAAISQWRLSDSGADTAWAGVYGGAVARERQEAQLAGVLPVRWGPFGGSLGLNGWWDTRGRWRAGGRGQVSGAESQWWRLSLERGGRRPRSDELLTADRLFSPTASYVLLPNQRLGDESWWRGSLDLRARLGGADFAVGASYRSLRNGITWVPTELDVQRGRWENGLELGAYTVTASGVKRTRCAGWLQLQALAAWRRQDIQTGRPAFLPPERSAALQLLWEHRFFREDGILQVGYWLLHRSANDDPWLPGSDFLLPARTQHDIVLGFRLVGVDLEAGLLNVTDRRWRLSSGALSYGRELRWRMHWTFSP
jgi:hypothetical protein